MSQLRADIRIEERWDQHVNTDIRQLLRDPSKARRAIKDTFLVQQANIYVTQQMVRYILLQYSEELNLLLQQEMVAQRTGVDDEAPGVDSLGRLAGSRRPLFSEDEKDLIVSDLLVILSKIPLEVIAVNTVALVAKVRYVASTLLDALQSTPPDPNDIPQLMHSSQRVARAQGYLCELCWKA